MVFVITISFQIYVMLIFKLRAFVFERKGTGNTSDVEVTFVQCRQVTMKLLVVLFFNFLNCCKLLNFFFLNHSYQYQIDVHFDKLASIFIYKSSVLFVLLFTAKAP